MTDPQSILSTVFTLCQFVHKRYELVKQCEQQADRLNNRVQIIGDSLKPLTSSPEGICKFLFETCITCKASGLNQLCLTLQSCVDLLDELGSSKWFKRFRKGNSYSKRFTELSTLLMEDQQTLQLGLQVHSAELFSNRGLKEDAQAAEADVNALQAKKEEIAEEILDEVKQEQDESSASLLQKQKASVVEFLEDTFKDSSDFIATIKNYSVSESGTVHRPRRTENSQDDLDLLDAKIKIPFFRLQFNKILGKGSYADVYEARWQNVDVAVKEIRDPYGSMQGELLKQSFASLFYYYRCYSITNSQCHFHYQISNSTALIHSQFEREVIIWARLRHPNIVLLMGACLEAKRACLVLELMHRGSLQDLIKKLEGEFPISRQKSISLDILRALCYMHSRDFCHRDLKCANVLIGKDVSVNRRCQPFHVRKVAVIESFKIHFQCIFDTVLAVAVTIFAYFCHSNRYSFLPPMRENRNFLRQSLTCSQFTAKLTDFGLTKVVNSDTVKTIITTASDSIHWRAPESLMRNFQFNDKCDMFSFGVVLFEIFTLELHGEESVPKTAAIRSRINEREMQAVRILIEDCLSQSPSARPSADAAFARLMKWIPPISKDAESLLMKALKAEEAKDYEEAYKKYLLAMNTGSIAAINRVGMYHIEGKFVPQNYNRAKERLIEGARMGHGKSMYNLYMLTHKIEGMEDDNLARKMLIRCTRGGEDRALEQFEKRMADGFM